MPTDPVSPEALALVRKALDDVMTVLNFNYDERVSALTIALNYDKLLRDSKRLDWVLNTEAGQLYMGPWNRAGIDDRMQATDE